MTNDHGVPCVTRLRISSKIIRLNPHFPLTNDQSPLEFMGRLLGSKLLLSGIPNQLRSDSSVRVSVKALALSCLAHVIALKPEVLLIAINKLPTSQDDHLCQQQEQHLFDVLLFADHHDPQLRGQLSLLLGFFIARGVIFGKGHFHPQLLMNVGGGGGRGGPCPNLDLEEMVGIGRLLDLLSTMLEDEASVTARLALISLQTCLPPLLRSSFHADTQNPKTHSQNPAFLRIIKSTFMSFDFPPLLFRSPFSIPRRMPRGTSAIYHPTLAPYTLTQFNLGRKEVPRPSDPSHLGLPC